MPLTSLSDFASAPASQIEHTVLDTVRESDQRGEYQQSLQVLYQAASKHDMPAVTELGKRLLYGDRAPQVMLQGAQLLQASAQEGNAEAMALTAMLHALGILPQSWQKALDYLAVAAHNGWQPARGQLIALSNHERLVQSVLQGESDTQDWKQLAGTVDHEFWMSPPAGKPLSESPGITTIPHFLPSRMAQWMTVLARPHLHRAKVYDAINKREAVTDYRSNSSVDLDIRMLDVATLLMQKRIGMATGIPVSYMEPLSILHYAKGEEIKPHYDFINSKDVATLEQIKAWGQRRITFITYLNDDYEGGETTFPKLGVENRGQCGDAIYFINIREGGELDLRTQHTGSPPTAGEKWVATQFIREREVINIDI